MKIFEREISEYCLLSAVLCSIFLAAGGAWPGIGMAFIFWGLFLFSCPADRTPPAGALVSIGILAGLIVLQCLPGSSFWAGNWHTELQEIYGFEFPRLLTVQPCITLEQGGMLLVALMVILLAMAHPLAAERRHLLLRRYGVACMAFALLCLMAYLFAWKIPGWSSPKNLGPFENRNQLADLIGCGFIVLLGLAYRDLGQKRRSGWMWVAGMILFLVLLVLNYSRAGLILVFVGSGLWFFLNMREWKTPARMVAVFSLVILLLAGFLVFGGKTLDRFSFSGESVATSRLLIQQDAWHMFREQPWLGSGLGSFAGLFPQYRVSLQSESFVRHPESDWVWLITEAGWPALLCVLCLLGYWIRVVFPFGRGTDRRVRSACFVATVMFCIHGLVDVSGHRFGSAIPALFLMFLSVSPRGLHLPESTMWVRRCFQGAGILGVLLGLLWLVEGAGWLDLPGMARVARAKATLPELVQSGRYGEADLIATRAIGTTPLSWELYFWRATARVGLGDDAEAIGDFRKSRALEKNNPNPVFSEAMLWMPTREDYALAAAGEMFRRTLRDPESKYQRLMLQAAASGSTRVLQELPGLALRQGSMDAHYWSMASEEDWKLFFEEMVSRKDQPPWFWPLAVRRESHVHILDSMEKNPGLISSNWKIYAEALAGTKNYKKAYAVLIQHVEPPVLPSLETDNMTEKQIRTRIMRDPHDLVAAYRLIQIQMAGGNPVAALETWDKLKGNASIPPYFYFMGAQAYAATENWEKAYEELARFESMK